MLRNIYERYLSRPLVQNLLAYTIAGVIIYYLARGISLHQIASSFQHANLWLFIPVSLVSFGLWFFGETYLFSRLFSFFHTRVKFRELLSANAAQYFLQIINMVVAGTALVFFLHRRKKVPWLAGGCTLLFQGYVDAVVLAIMSLLAALLMPSSPIHAGLWWAVGALAIFGLIAVFWLLAKPVTSLGRWFKDRPALRAFREARPYHYLTLAGIRTPIFALQGPVLWAQLLAFHVKVPLLTVLAFTPAVLVMGGLPITPVGMGPLQAVLVTGFKDFASKPELLAMALAVSAINFLFRIPLGLTSAGAFAKEVSAVGRHDAAATAVAVTEQAGAEIKHEIKDDLSLERSGRQRRVGPVQTPDAT